MPAALRLAITGGGTGGHVSPALAVLTELRQRLAGGDLALDVLWIGSEDGLEAAAARDAGATYVAIPTGKLRRYLTLATLRDATRLPRGLLAARRALAAFQPAVVFSTGGFVSVPAVVAARWLDIPCLTHEQTVTVGLANRINARLASRVALSYAASCAWLPRHPWLGGAPEAPLPSSASVPAGRFRRRSPAPLVLTGNPVRPALLAGQAERAVQHFDLDPARPVVYLTGGARGSHALNLAAGAALPDLLAITQIVHQTGPVAANGDLPRLERLAAGLPAPLRAGYRPVPFVGAELPDLYALACLVVGRAGAGTIAELAALGKPALLIPLPGAAADEQTRNAHLLAGAGAAVVLPEAEATPARLTREIAALLADPSRLAAMGAAARQFARPDAAARLVDHLLDLAGRPPTAPWAGRS
jgi:UDP-N-acetylglucosamine--N-acetylmuramyl-(pentapeptide) pyrophosphoryl-undecaprenol N-acetylglucosamine transferase